MFLFCTCCVAFFLSCLFLISLFSFHIFSWMPFRMHNSCAQSKRAILERSLIYRKLWNGRRKKLGYSSRLTDVSDCVCSFGIKAAQGIFIKSFVNIDLLRPFFKCWRELQSHLTSLICFFNITIYLHYCGSTAGSSTEKFIVQVLWSSLMKPSYCDHARVDFFNLFFC